MRWHARLCTLGLLLPTLITAVPAHAQYLYLDSNGDGVRDAQDRLDPAGPTTIDVWLDTQYDRDGTPVICDADAGTGMTINSYSFVLHALGGTMSWGPMQNRLPFTIPPGRLASDNDTTDPVFYHNGWAGRETLPPGRYMLATLTVQPTSGHPGIFVEPYHPILATRITAFGTQCLSIDYDNTYKLGLDWQDASGFGPPHADPGGPYVAATSEAVTFHGGGSRDPDGAALAYSWEFGDGAAGAGVSPTHAYAAAGHYAVQLTVTSESGTDTGATEAAVTDPHQPTARAGGPYSGREMTPVHFDGRGSFDPDGDGLRFDWTFGDGLQASGMTVDHAYTAAGDYRARLTVADGSYSDTDETDVTILPAAVSAPVARPGGPYTGFVDRNIQFDGRQSSDADGQEISFAWRFGDGTTGIGSSTGHSYAAPGVFDVTLTVSDGTLAGSAGTTATILAGMAARVITAEPGTPILYLGADEAPLSWNIQADHGGFGVLDMDPWSVTMRSAGTGSVPEIAAQDQIRDDQDLNGDGVRELNVLFAAADLAKLFDQITQPTLVTVTLAGRLYAGGFFYGDLQLDVRPGAGALLKITPNPFNPQAMISFHLTRPGPVRANLFDVRGRMVRTVLRGQRMEPGTHEVPLDARGDQGVVLASGIYFLRLDGPDGVVTRRVAVTK